jgi:hypothetical protein
MYYAMIVLLMGVLPLISIFVEHMLAPAADLVLLSGRWFVFWAGGIRLGLAGVRQIANPAFTARTIFEIEDAGANKIVQELGFANVVMALLSVASIARPDWVLPAAIVTGLYYGLAGGMHVLKAGRNRTETWAMVSDLLMFVLLCGYAVIALVRGL